MTIEWFTLEITILGDKTRQKNDHNTKVSISPANELHHIVPGCALLLRQVMLYTIQGLGYWLKYIGKRAGQYQSQMAAYRIVIRSFSTCTFNSLVQPYICFYILHSTFAFLQCTNIRVVRQKAAHWNQCFQGLSTQLLTVVVNEPADMWADMCSITTLHPPRLYDIMKLKQRIPSSQNNKQKSEQGIIPWSSSQSNPFKEETSATVIHR